jgi:hypothetical protein
VVLVWVHPWLNFFAFFASFRGKSHLFFLNHEGRACARQLARWRKAFLHFPNELIKLAPRMKRSLSFLLFLLLPVTVLADGKMIPTIALPANVTIPDQRALIHFTNDTERLVIETRFTGSGTNFAWVVPLPGQPVIEEASTGLFPTLQYLFRPNIQHNIPHYYLGILFLIVIVCLFRLAAQSVSNAFKIAIVIFILLLLFLAASLIPTLAPAGSRRMVASLKGPEEQTVSILDRKLVGIFEITTVASRDPNALQAWLRDNGFAVPTNTDPVIASYVKDGWVFVAAKVRRDTAGLETSTPHPLSFTFKTDKPVYPMRLTGVDNGPLEVELYVFGPARANASHFKVERCTRPNYPELPSKDMMYWRSWSPETPDIVHPLLRKWVNGSPVATKLTATLSPADMRQDVWLDWVPFSEKKNHLFSKTGARTRALNWGSGLFAAGLLAVYAFLFANETHKPKLPRLIGILTATSLGLAGLIYLSLPKTEVRLVRKFQGSKTVNTLYNLYFWLDYTNMVTLPVIKAEASRVLSNPTNDVDRVRSAQSDLKDPNNELLGGHIHEEDSPGNYTIRENGGRLEFVAYDAQGAEHVFVIGE